VQVGLLEEVDRLLTVADVVGEEREEAIAREGVDLPPGGFVPRLGPSCHVQVRMR
jgi:hypothetical protein